VSNTVPVRNIRRSAEGICLAKTIHTFIRKHQDSSRKVLLSPPDARWPCGRSTSIQPINAVCRTQQAIDRSRRACSRNTFLLEDLWINHSLLPLLSFLSSYRDHPSVTSIRYTIRFLCELSDLQDRCTSSVPRMSEDGNRCMI